MAIIEKIAGDKVELQLKDRFTFSDSTEFRKRLLAALDSGARSLTIDLSGLVFMDSAGLGMLMVAHKECQQRSMLFSVAQPRDNVKQMLQLTKSYERFPIID